MTVRLAHTIRFYDLLDCLEDRVGGTRVLTECNGKMNWPQRGVYFFFESGESRAGSGAGCRVVRIGTHALKLGSPSTLWTRLSQHRGPTRSGGGNHRGSIFRLLVGDALARRGDLPRPKSWGCGSNFGVAAKRFGLDNATIKQDEARLELRVSKRIGAMPFLWLNIGDAPGAGSQRAFIERNSIALLSADEGEPSLDPPSPGWLGLYSNRENIRRSGLWNNHYVGEAYDPSFLGLLKDCIGEAQPI